MVSEIRVESEKPVHLAKATCSIAIHQPEHMPWAGFFNKMSKCDIYVILDSVQFCKNNWQNRNRFVDVQGYAYWLTVPVKLKHHTQKEFKEMEIATELPWQRKYLNSLRANYSNTPFFKSHFEPIAEIISASYEKLIDLNMALISYFRDLFQIRNELVFSSTLGVSGHKSALLVDICKKLGANSYISGTGGAAYLETSLFEENNIDLVFHEFHPQKTLLDVFHDNTSILDLLFHNGTQRTRDYVFNYR